MNFPRRRISLALALVLCVGAALRCFNVGFGLPALLDPDEPLFVLKAFTLLDKGTLNPGWFGHPGSTTIYLLAVVDILVVSLGLASGSYANLPAFAQAVYQDPGIVFLPSRLAFVAIALGVVVMTYLLGRRLFGAATGLLASALLAVNSLHVAWSQVIRTDIHASLFMMASLYFSTRTADKGRSRDLALAGLFAGFATATKWPAGSVIVGGLGAIALLATRGERPLDLLRRLALLVASLLVGVFLASPYIFLDWQTVLQNVSGEVVRGHLGHASRGLGGNLHFYGDELVRSSGWPAFVLAAVGLLVAARHRVTAAVLLPVTILFAWLISSQPQIWARWLTPLLPMFALLASAGSVALFNLVIRDRSAGARQITALLSMAVLLVPGLIASVTTLRERANDTRLQATAWAAANIPPGSTILVEHFALDLRRPDWRILFPLGASGCIDGVQALQNGVRYDDVQKARAGSPIADVGNLSPNQVATCRADFAIFTYYDLYVAEGLRYRRQLLTYQQVVGSGKTVALFRPKTGVSAGPVTRIVAMGPHD